MSSIPRPLNIPCTVLTHLSDARVFIRGRGRGSTDLVIWRANDPVLVRKPCELAHYRTSLTPDDMCVSRLIHRWGPYDLLESPPRQPCRDVSQPIAMVVDEHSLWTV